MLFNESDMVTKIQGSPGECGLLLVHPLQSHPPSTGKLPPFKHISTHNSLWKEKRNIHLVVAADSNVVAKLLTWVPLACTHLPSDNDRDHFVRSEKGQEEKVKVSLNNFFSTKTP